MRHAVLAAAIAFRTAIRPTGAVVPTRRVGRLVMAWLDRRRRIQDDRHHATESELWSPPAV